MSPLRPLAITLWVAVFLFAGLFAANRWLRPPAPAPTPAMAAPTADPPKPERLPAFTLNDLKGQPRASSEWAGRTVLWNFWATWCAPCRREMPLLQQYAEAEIAVPGTAGVVVIGIAIDRDEPVLRFVGETGVTYPILVGQLDASRVAESFGDAFRALPFSVVSAPDGSILAIHTGELKAADLAGISRAAAGLAAGRMSLAEAKGVMSFRSESQ
jgi:thiol-disulfide isomerase/thioredoxin